MALREEFCDSSCLYQFAWLVEVIHDHLLGVDAEAVVNRSQQFARVDRIAERCRARLVALSVNVSSFDSGAGNECGVAIRPVVATVGTVVVSAGTDATLWAAAEFTDGDDKRVFE